MPTYSYRCTECEKAFDIHQAFTDDTLTVCPNCGGVLRKIFSPVGVTFTGSGFYRNDSRSTTSSSESAGKSSSSTSTPSTPASTPAATPAAATAKPAASS